MTDPADKTILVVDDDESVLFGIVFMLQKLGYQVLSAENSQNGLEIFKENSKKIDLTILDLVMPEMNGQQLFLELRKIDPNCRILLSSGFVTEEDAAVFADLGCEGILYKPYKISVLSEKIQSIFTAG